MSNWPFPAQRQNSDQLDRLHKAATTELEQGISREIAARVKAAESRAVTLARKCERLADEVQHKDNTIATMAAVIQAKDALIAGLWDAEDAARLAGMAAEWDRARRGVDSSMPIWDALCEAIGEDADGDGMRAAIDAAMRASKGGE